MYYHKIYCVKIYKHSVCVLEATVSWDVGSMGWMGLGICISTISSRKSPFKNLPGHLEVLINEQGPAEPWFIKSQALMLCNCIYRGRRVSGYSAIFSICVHTHTHTHVHTYSIIISVQSPWKYCPLVYPDSAICEFQWVSEPRPSAGLVVCLALTREARGKHSRGLLQ